ncbi:MAG: hypothetical protein A3I75_05280 [Deltaproteobacteria bacterium RIFCSPLOWO2_02_FULL_50_16]|nr:MAG: hypothetical protein A3B79_05685 [Deltaproteobacteria bacterium RIFCSPHIGHO2_02_FULL_50_15]OGQ57691.1 MAG: hypothetical protein A3I75_05280 [Deltaproteobacteria bacterium RIFCSPLOWO2_02_FULL_50_16]OGQ68455.1 MAG: hypothetical protein A3F89_04165 [Deltaproteobacteria bacterium RIFCSPLOWO2_12_FULL_50_11]
MGANREIAGKRRLRGNRVSHANNKTIHYQRPNTQERRLFVPELGLYHRVRVAMSTLKTIDKLGGLTSFVLHSDPVKLPPKLRQLRRVLVKKGLH